MENIIQDMIMYFFQELSIHQHSHYQQLTVIQHFHFH